MERRARKAQKKLGKLLKQVDKLEAQIAELEPLAKTMFAPTAPAAPAAKAKPGRKPGKKPAATKAKATRAMGKSLGQYVAEVLTVAPKGLSIKAIEKAVRKAGYPTVAKNIYNPIMKVLGKGGFQKVEAGVYAVKNAIAAAAAEVAAPKAPKAKAKKTAAAPVTKVTAPKTSKAKRKKRGKFAKTADQFILGMIGEGATTSQLKKAWQAEGRGGKVDNTLTLLVKKGKLKREKLADGRGSHYRPK
jgi:hypothetical protein